MDPFQASEYASISISIAILASVAWSDLKTREVSDKVWLVYGPLGLAFTVYRLWVEPSLLLLSAGFCWPLDFGCLWFGVLRFDWRSGCPSVNLPKPSTPATPRGTDSGAGLFSAVLPDRRPVHGLSGFNPCSIRDDCKEPEPMGTDQVRNVQGVGARINVEEGPRLHYRLSHFTHPISIHFLSLPNGEGSGG